MRRLIASVLLVAALLTPIPVAPVDAVSCPGAGGSCITGVPATFNWGTATIGTERRAVLSTLVTYYSTTGYVPTITITRLCRTGSACTGVDVISGSNMKIAVGPDNCGNASATCIANGTSPCNSLATDFQGLVVSNPAAAGAGITPPATSNLCSSNATANPTLRLANFNIAVTVPAGKAPGTYTSTITFGM